MLYTSNIQIPEEKSSLSSRAIKLLVYGLILFLVSFVLPISSKAGNNIYYGLVLIPFLFTLATKNRAYYSTGKLFPYFLLLITTMMLVSLPDDAGKAIKCFIYITALWVIVSTLVRNKVIDPDQLALFMMMISLLYASSILFYHYIVLDNPLTSRANYWYLFRLGNPIMVCMLLTFFTTIGVKILIDRRRYLVSVLIILFSVFMQILFQTRTGFAGYIGVLSAIPFIIFFSTVSSKEKKMLLISLVVIVLLSALALQVGLFDTLIDRGISYRTELYILSFDEYLENCNLITGCGMNYEFNSTLSSGAPINHPHSIYSSQLLYFGLFSFLFLLVLQLRAATLFIRQPSPWFYGLIASSAFFLLDGSKTFTNPDIEWMFLWLPLAVLDGLTEKKGILDFITLKLNKKA